MRRFSKTEILLGLTALATASGCDALVGPSLKVDQKFATYQEAVDAGALHGNSYIPPFTPKSATDIHDVHDADIDTGHGTFAFDTADADDFRQSLAGHELSPAGQQALEAAPEPTEQAYRLEDHLLYVDWEAGKCRWWIELRGAS